MKKFLKILLALVLAAVLFKGWIYRHVVHYKQVGTRETIPLTDEKLLAEIDSVISGKALGFEEIIETAKLITNKRLRFKLGKVSKNPNELLQSGEANCIGYSALFNAIVQYLIAKQGLSGSVEARHLIGKLDVFGINLHQFFADPFYKDHDFNQVINIKTGVSVWIDPSVSDYLGIDRVTLKH